MKFRLYRRLSGVALSVGLQLGLLLLSQLGFGQSKQPNISTTLEVYEVSNEGLSVEGILEKKFQLLSDRFVHEPDRVTWVKAQVQNTSSESESITIGIGRLAFVSMFLLNEEQIWEERKAGFLCPGEDMNPEDGRDHFTMHFVQGEKRLILLRVKDPTHLNPHLTIKIQPTLSYNEEGLWSLKLGLITSGAFWGLFVYVLFGFLTNRKQLAYLWLTLYTMALGLYSLSLRGYWIGFVFPDAPVFGWAFNELFYHLAIVSAYLFAIEFWNIKSITTRLHKLYLALAGFVFCKGIVGFIYIYLTLNNDSLIMVNIITFPLETILPGVFLLWKWAKFSKNQRQVLWAVLVVCVISVIRILEYVLSSEIDLESLAFLAEGSGIASILIFSIGLVAESKRRLQERNIALSEINSLQKEQNSLLEQKVAERTLEVSQANASLQSKNHDLEDRNQRIEVLLSEIHHRVKNNFQLVTSLLDLQSKRSNSGDMQEALNESQIRIRSMALIHEKLYEKDELTEIGFETYVRELFDQIAATYSPERKVAFHLECPDVTFSIDTAIPLGLILNELMTNAFKYGFDKETPRASIVLERTDEEGYSLLFHDNGPGIVGKVDFKRNSTLGLRLLGILSRQLRGKAAYIEGEGATFKITFKTLR